MRQYTKRQHTRRIGILKTQQSKRLSTITTIRYSTACTNDITNICRRWSGTIAKAELSNTQVSQKRYYDQDVGDVVCGFNDSAIYIGIAIRLNKPIAY